LYAYAYAYRDVGQVLKGIAFRELTQYMASVDLFRIMAQDRGEAAVELRKRIEEEAAKLKLGVKIVYVGFLGIHPPRDVAKDFETVVAAEQKKEASRQEALRRQNEILAQVAGSRVLAEDLYKAIGELEKLEAAQPANREGLKKREARVEELLLGKAGTHGGALGKAAEIINKARSTAYRVVSEAQSQQNEAARVRESYYAAPEYYRRRRWLRTFSDAIKDLPKYVLAFMPDEPPYLRISQGEDDIIKLEGFEEEEGQ
jgi:regulator of protease activity HflC (stomatin/prohibitin superfamily)